MCMDGSWTIGVETVIFGYIHGLAYSMAYSMILYHSIALRNNRQRQNT